MVVVMMKKNKRDFLIPEDNMERITKLVLKHNTFGSCTPKLMRGGATSIYAFYAYPDILQNIFLGFASTFA
jgi:hypothetical protein